MVARHFGAFGQRRWELSDGAVLWRWPISLLRGGGGSQWRWGGRPRRGKLGFPQRVGAFGQRGWELPDAAKLRRRPTSSLRRGRGLEWRWGARPRHRKFLV